MNVFFSGSSSGASRAGTDDDPRLIEAAPVHFRLASCHGNYLKVAYKTLDRVVEAGYSRNCEIMLDSGAFTAWSKGEEVELSHLTAIYSDFVNKYEHLFKAIWLINLDKIPAEKGRTATPDEIVEAMHISDSNFEKLQGTFAHRVLPVFHQNEPKEQLMKLAAACNYVCISPRNDLPEASRVVWAREAHDLVPDLKTHGLAATGSRMMAEVPWGSVDSATWVALGAYGKVIFENDRKLTLVAISEKAGSIKDWDDHFDNLSSIERQALEARFSKYQFTVEELRQEATSRMLFNRIALIKYAARYQKAAKQAAPIQKGLFDL